MTISTHIVFTHRIAGLAFRTEANARFTRLEEDIYERFRVGDSVQPDISQRLHRVSSDSLTLPPPVEGERKRLEGCVRHPDQLDGPILRSPLVRARLQACLDRPEKTDIAIAQDQVDIRDFLCNTLEVFYTSERGGYDEELQGYFPEYWVAANFRQMFSSFLPSFSAILIHSSGVIRDDKAALFLAPDSGGKTTVLNLSDGGILLNDDQVILRWEKSEIVAHGTPLGRMTSGPCGARVGALFVLDRGRRFRLTPLHPADLVQCLWTENQNYTFFLPQHLKKRAFDILHKACHQVPTYRMYFPKDHVDWDAIDAAMAG
jgi:hypothetical protein